MRSNCLIWALGQLIREGGYIAFRRTRTARLRRLAWWPHFLWSPDLKRWYAFMPLDKRDVLSPPLLFRGHVCEGDG